MRMLTLGHCLLLASTALLQACAVYPVESGPYYGGRDWDEPGYRHSVTVYGVQRYGGEPYENYGHRSYPSQGAYNAPRYREQPAEQGRRTPEPARNEPARSQPESRHSALPLPPMPPMPFADFGRRGPRPFSGH